VSTIGVGERCCWCCSWLAEHLHTAHPQISFNVPASNGLIFPWALPTIGISLSVAESLERALKELWHRQVVEFAEEYAERARKRIQSAITTPPDLEPDYSFSFEAEDLGALLSEWEKSLE
jgi:hypothetical protein